MNDATTLTTEPTASATSTPAADSTVAPAVIELSTRAPAAPESSTTGADPATAEVDPANAPANGPVATPATIGDAMSGKVTSEAATEAAGTAASLIGESTEGTKKARAPRAPKAAPKPVEGGSITAVVERAVRMTLLADEHAAALGRLFNISLPDDHIAKLTRLTGISLGQIGTTTAEALAIVLSLESANPIHVGVQLGRLPITSLPDVYRCAHALTGSTPPALPKGDSAVFAVADVLATLTAEDFALARSLSVALA
jgi:hypothetical protein